MSRILKYEIKHSSSTNVPRGKILLAGVQNQNYFVWILVSSDVTRQIQIFGTGEHIESHWDHAYSFQNGDFVWHVFES